MVIPETGYTKTALVAFKTGGFIHLILIILNKMMDRIGQYLREVLISMVIETTSY